MSSIEKRNEGQIITGDMKHLCKLDIISIGIILLTLYSSISPLGCLGLVEVANTQLVFEPSFNEAGASGTSTKAQTSGGQMTLSAASKTTHLVRLC